MVQQQFPLKVITALYFESKILKYEDIENMAFEHVADMPTHSLFAS